jgi:hypothetical protein
MQSLPLIAKVLIASLPAIIYTGLQLKFESDGIHRIEKNTFSEHQFDYIIDSRDEISFLTNRIIAHNVIYLRDLSKHIHKLDNINLSFHSTILIIGEDSVTIAKYLLNKGFVNVSIEKP